MKWKEVKGYEENYAVSDTGKVVSFPRNGTIKKKKNLKAKINKFGYPTICLHKNNIKKYFFIHRLVAIAFIQNIDNKPFINHKDGNKKNNLVSNLEWCTRKENSQHAVRLELCSVGDKSKSSVLSEKQVKEILSLRKKGVTYKKLSEQFNVCFSTINNILNRRKWKHKKFDYIFNP